MEQHFGQTAYSHYPSLPVKSGERAVALTFDDGPNPDATPAILDALASRSVKATFFILGRHAERWPGLAPFTVRSAMVSAPGFAESQTLSDHPTVR